MTSSSMQALASKIDLEDLEFCKARMGNFITLGEGAFGQVITGLGHTLLGHEWQLGRACCIELKEISISLHTCDCA